ncbi:Prephenate dehydratase-domain-containing protein [Xylaria intraflava]|nr:Prephenate dehydratase-domain-containing protein [Xylaria intraflava]
MEANEQSAPGGPGSKPVVCFLGPTSSYTHQATTSAFPADQFTLMPVTTINDIFATTQSGDATYGVVPFENSTNGSVVFTLDNFADRSGAYKDLNVCREIYLDVHHCLVGHAAPLPSSTSPPAPHPISRLRRVYSHPQAFGQCLLFLESQLRGVEMIDVSSTSRAAQLAKDDPTGESAAVSSAMAAEKLGIDVLVRNIEDRQDNTTRFFVVRRGTEPSSALQRADVDAGADDAKLLSATKSLLSFTVPHRSPGKLADVLACFQRGGLNLTSISSRPSFAAAFEYIFFVEFEGHRFRDPQGRVARVLDDVAAIARTSRWLGSWDNMRQTSA